VEPWCRVKARMYWWPSEVIRSVFAAEVPGRRSGFMSSPWLLLEVELAKKEVRSGRSLTT
jgi:hypothetical protein